MVITRSIASIQRAGRYSDCGMAIDYPRNALTRTFHAVVHLPSEFFSQTHGFF